MAKGIKTGGRKAGTPNKAGSNAVLAMIIAKLGCDPLEALAEIAANKREVQPGLRVKALAELAKYGHAQLRAVEHSGPGGEQLTINVRRIGS